MNRLENGGYDSVDDKHMHDQCKTKCHHERKVKTNEY